MSVPIDIYINVAQMMFRGRVWMCKVVYNVIDHANVCIYLGQSLSRPTHHPGKGLFLYYLVFTAIGALLCCFTGTRLWKLVRCPRDFHGGRLYISDGVDLFLACIALDLSAATYCVLSRASRCIVHLQHLCSLVARLIK